MKTAIKILIDSGVPQAKPRPLTREEKVAAILKKIEYAGECIEYDHQKHQAIRFLQQLHRKLLMHKQMRDDTQMLIEKCYRKITEYGTLPIGAELDEEECADD